MSSDDHNEGERDIIDVLRGAGRRREPPPELMQSVRFAVEMEWRAAVTRRRRLRRSVGMGVSVAAAIVVAAAVAWTYRALVSPAEEVASVSLVSGSVRARVGVFTGWQPLAAHAPVRVHERLATGPQGRAALSLPHDVSLRLDHDTRVRIEASGRITLEAGAVYVDAGPGPARGSRGLQIATPFGILRHVGTQYQARLGATGVRVAVREGAIELDTSGGARQRANAGEQMLVSSTGVVSRSAISPYDESWSWTSTVAPGFSIDGHTVSEFLAWAARELGRDVVFADRAAESEASRVRLSGSIAGLTPSDALAAVLPTTGLRSELRGGKMLISVSTAAD